MLQSHLDAEETGALGGMALYDAPKWPKPLGKKKTVVTGKAPKSAARNVEWVDHIRRIHEAGDRKAFAEVFSHFAPRIKAFLIKSGATHAMAEECTQDVMATVWTKAHLFDPSRAGVATWVFTIARNRQIDVFRKLNRPQPEDLPWGPEAEPDQADALALQQETQTLRGALAALPDEQRDLIARAYYGDLSHGEIAKQTGLPLGTIKSRIRLALNKLRHSLDTTVGQDK